MAINYKKCPKCGSKNLVKIVYGIPSYELFQEAEVGKVKLGGCVIIEGNPEYFCIDCEHEWNREQAIDEAYNKTAEDFIEMLKMINLLNWKAKYIELGVCDGTQWSVEILTAGRTIRKHGNNKFPEEWNSFCGIIKRITRKEFR